MNMKERQMDALLQEVENCMVNCVEDSALRNKLPAKNILGSGKMLRARLVLSLGMANGIDQKSAIHAATSVEILHGASLLHDDVIDNGLLRRGLPTFWKKHGTNGAILLGDLLVLKSMDLLSSIQRLDLLQELIAQAILVCRSEVEQELILRGTPGSWAECEQIARQNTGALFAFAAVAAAKSPNEVDALREAGFLLGTAYQLADDILDASGNEALSGKTLGRDQERGKTTAISSAKKTPDHPKQRVENLLAASLDQLESFPDLHTAWNCFLDDPIRPLLQKYTA
jgi:geranylgeranyl pyrophosphate synthase